MECKGVGLVHPVAAYIGLDMVLVEGALAEAGDEALPDTGITARSQPGAPLCPLIEIPCNINVMCVGRPDGEVSAVVSIPGNRVGPQLVIEAQVAALVEKVEVIFAKQAESRGIGAHNLAHPQSCRQPPLCLKGSRRCRTLPLIMELEALLVELYQAGVYCLRIVEDSAVACYLVQRFFQPQGGTVGTVRGHGFDHICHG